MKGKSQVAPQVARAKPKKPTKCLTCKNKPKSRGLCDRCLRYARTLIERQEYTEDGLIKDGLMLPAQRRGPKTDNGLAKTIARRHRKVS